VQTGVAALDHPVPALLEALDAGTRLGPVGVEDGLIVVQFTIAQGPTLCLAVDPAMDWRDITSMMTKIGEVRRDDRGDRAPGAECARLLHAPSARRRLSGRLPGAVLARRAALNLRQPAGAR
jgi:hypothetical protein